MAEFSEVLPKRMKLPATAGEPTESADRISQLPDALLTDILSLLPTKQSVATAVLSKRWCSLWADVPVLHFDDRAPPKRSLRRDEIEARWPTGFARFVYSVLMSHQARNIKLFRLRCAYPSCSERDIATWMGHVARRGVEEMELSLSLSRYVALPRSLFNCDTVSVLRLDGVFLNALASFSVRLSSLRVLHVGDKVLFGFHDYLVKLLAGCPVLEELVLESTYNVACGGPVCAQGNFQLNLDRLVKVRIGFSWKERCQKSMFVLSQAFNNVRFLALSPSTVECLKYAAASDIPVFNNLLQLEISFGNYSWDLLANLLGHSHKLEVLIIYKESQKCVKGQEPRWKHPLFVPECLLLHLKTFYIREYHGLESELEFVGYIMQNTRVLETMAICLASFLDLEAKQYIRSNLSLLQINFKSCEIEFH